MGNSVLLIWSVIRPDFYLELRPDKAPKNFSTHEMKLKVEQYQSNTGTGKSTQQCKVKVTLNMQKCVAFLSTL